MTETVIWRAIDDFGDLNPNALVLAFCTGDLEANPKYGANIVGPLRLSPTTSRKLDRWASWALDLYGGYVHLVVLELDKLEDEMREAESELDELLEE